MKHKQFKLEKINFLMQQARHLHLQNRGAEINASCSGSNTSSPNKRPRIQASKSKSVDIPTSLKVFPERLSKRRKLHTRVRNQFGIKGCCVYCSMLYLKNKNDNETLTYNAYVRRTVKVCNYCLIAREGDKCAFLCKEHFDIFHYTT